jgi:hypothetical protein
MAQDFVRMLFELYQLRLTLDRKKVVKGISVENYVKQLLGNRKGSFRVTGQVVLADKSEIQVILHNWMPARGGSLGFDGEHVDTSESGSVDIWRDYASGVATPENAKREVLALMVYFHDQILSGKGDSGESLGKAICLEFLYNQMKPKSFDISRQLSDKSAVAYYEKTNILGLLRGLAPRMALVMALDNKDNYKPKSGKPSIISLGG